MENKTTVTLDIEEYKRLIAVDTGVQILKRHTLESKNYVGSDSIACVLGFELEGDK